MLYTQVVEGRSSVWPGGQGRACHGVVQDRSGPLAFLNIVSIKL